MQIKCDMAVVRDLSTVMRRFSSHGCNERPSGQIKKIGVAVTAIGIEKTWTKTPQRTESVRLCVKWG